MTSLDGSTDTITIRNLDHRVKDRLRSRAAENGRSVEAEARSILAETLGAGPDESMNLAEAIRRHMAPLGGIDLDEHPPVPIGDPISFDQ